MLAPKTAPRGWNRPVKPGALLAVGVLVLVAWLVTVADATWYVYSNWEARFAMRDQPVRLRLPEGLLAEADVASPIPTRIDLRPKFALRLNQPVRVQPMGPLQASADLRTRIPIDTTVHVQTTVPVRTTLALSVSLKSWLPRIPVQVPVQIDLPIDMRVPVKAEVPVALQVEVTGELPASLLVPVHAAFQLRPRVQSDIEVRMLSATRFRLAQAPQPIDVRIAHSDVRVPFNLTLRHRWLP